MKHITIFAITLFFISTISAQNNNLKTIFKEYSKHSISFDNPKIQEYSDKRADLYNDFCTERLSSAEYIRKFNILNRIYAVYFVNITDNDKTSLGKVQKLVHEDGEVYLKEKALKEAKIYAKSEFKKQNKALYDRVKKADISFKNKHFEKFANEMQDLVFKQCSTKMSQDEYDKQSLKIRAKYVKHFKDVSKEDTENLFLLYDATSIKCTEYTIEQQYSMNR